MIQITFIATYFFIRAANTIPFILSAMSDFSRLLDTCVNASAHEGKG